ncbi:MAG: Trk system potassium transporter TrkA [Deltaproteobacteria bacterium]|nr:MAG: Trk system potassium transporter TrkA [Deltaproteobacteria bacterium]
MKIVIVGAGEVGFHIARRLSLESKDVVVVDCNPDALQRLTDSIDVQTVSGSGSNPSILESAGIDDAEILLAVTDSDESNLVACLVADTLAPATKKLARLRGADFERYHDAFRNNAPHIDTVINPDREVVHTILQLMDAPGAVDVGDFAGGRIRFVGVHLDAESRLTGVKLADLPDIIDGDRPLIAAIVRKDRLIVPRGDNHLHAGDLVYFICEAGRLGEYLSIFGKPVVPVKRVMIVGGGRIGYRLARMLEQQSLGCKLIEKQAERCEWLADRLDRTVVLHGDGSDQGLLAEEGITEVDLVITLTSAEETNILTSLLAKRLGAKRAITRIDKFSYFPLVTAVGIEQVVSPRLSAINSILKHIRRGKVLSAISIKGEDGEVMEAVALPTSDIVSRPLRKIAFPKGALLAGIIRGESIIIPSGESVVEPDDRIIIFATREAISRVEKMLAVKLEYV